VLARLLCKPFVNLPRRFVLKRLHKAFPSGPAPRRFRRIGRILVFLEGLVIRTAAQQKGIPAFDKNHLIAAIPADLCEPVELTEFELDAVAGGNPFSQNGVAVALAQEYTNINVGQIGVDAVASAISFGNG
jgi:hypothetical protein